MLEVPVFQEIEGVTIYKDDTIWYKFYPIAEHPSIRLDEKGKPVFLLINYSLSDEQRQQNPDLKGGGYLNFDIEFSVLPDVLERVRSKLQDWVNSEWNRLRNGTAEEQALLGVKDTTAPPTVEFGEPTWTGGKVAMDAPQSAILSTARVAEGEPSLLSGNLAVFSMDLTPAGAGFMEKTLLGDGQTGATNLTPIQVKYDLKFWAKLPKVRIHVSADSKRVYEQTRKIMEGQGVDYCTTYDFSHSDITTETASLTGLIDVQIDPGSSNLPEDELASLRQFALSLVQEMIESNFFTDEPPSSEDDDNIDRPPANRPGDTNTKKYLKQNFDNTTMNIELNLEQRSVVEWKIAPQATLQTFFKGMSQEELKNYVRFVNLETGDFFKELKATVYAFADYKDPAINGVEVQLRYSGKDVNGIEDKKEQTFTFTSNAPQTWTVGLLNGKREYEYRYRVLYRDRAGGEYTTWTKHSQPELPISVPSGRVKATVSTGIIDFANLVNQVQVIFAYEDAQRHVPYREDPVILTPARVEAEYDRLIYETPDQPLRYKRRFMLKSGEVIEDRDWKETKSGGQVLINQPYENKLEVRLIPVGNGWDEVAQVVVDLRYSDSANDYVAAQSLILKSKEELRTWSIDLRNKEKRDFEYKVTASYKDGRFERSDWKPATGEDIIPIEIKARPGFKVQLVPNNLMFDTAPVTEVTLRYKDQSETFVFRDKTIQTWLINVPDQTAIDYTYQVTHYPVGSAPIILPEVRETDSAVILPAYIPPLSGKLKVNVRSQLVDFAKTPLVIVDLHYLDEVNKVDEIGSLTFEKKETQTWEINIRDSSRKFYDYKVTYYFADDTLPAKTIEFAPQTDLNIVLPKI